MAHFIALVYCACFNNALCTPRPHAGTVTAFISAFILMPRFLYAIIMQVQGGMHCLKNIDFLVQPRVLAGSVGRAQRQCLSHVWNGVQSPNKQPAFVPPLKFEYKSLSWNSQCAFLNALLLSFVAARLVSFTFGCFPNHSLINSIKHCLFP